MPSKHSDIPECMVAEEIRHATQAGDHMTMYWINEWPATRTEVQAELQSYWPFQDNVGVIGGIVMKGRRIIVPASLQ